ncbi:unnamed protein product [Polarella glacialis]|uniref:Uncharacterized protein n=1 Tax=Polarella glacialis TaxID=89957 RepID=A0A813JQJ8_POLGL|nr:unnamed protein product [Polarella glacialis]CAE8680650.1 unnamed protein product [Polarella glacialis]
MGRFSGPGTFGALVLALTVGRVLYSPCVRRLFRNTALPGIPDPVAPVYPSCSDAELIAKVSLVVTVKDTCAQAKDLLTHLSTIFPAGIHVYYAYPAIRGCRHFAAGEAGKRLFSNFTEVAVGASDAPIAGFLKVQSLLQTKYAVLMHNDAFPMERVFACELYRALEANPSFPIAAPQIYEAASDKVIVPHGHHQNLHVRPSKTSTSSNGHRIDYDLSLHLLTQRKPDDFKEGPQVDFLEDHAFMARADRYHELLDPSGSFTLEYMDMILNMRARNTSAWYVPTARVLFNVDINKITWEDLPYLVYKRSEQIGHQVRTYLTNKWDVEFVNTGIWNYVRYVMLAEVIIKGPDLPTNWSDQAAVFFCWFESVGFNRYNGQYLPDFIEDPAGGKVNISRTMRYELPTDVPAHRVPPKRAMEILPKMPRKKAGAIDISFKEPHLPIGVKMTECSAEDPSSYRFCGMAVQDGDQCTCYTYIVPFNLKTTLYLDKLMAMMKLPARAFMYGQMKYWPVSIDVNNVDFFCDRTQEECTFELQFSKDAKVLQWSWFGEQDKTAFTPEGMAICGVLSMLLILPVLFSSTRMQRWVGSKKQQFRSFTALNAAVCNHAAMRS